jgi:hypothetical protein
MTRRRTGCRACGHRVLSPVLDLGAVPAGLPGEPRFPLAMHLCGDCGLAPDALVSEAADEVVLMDPELSQELATQLPELEGRWVTDHWIGTHAG